MLRRGARAPQLALAAALLAAACASDPADPVGDDDGDDGDDDVAADVCGDGQVTGAEVCDDGDNAGRAGGCMPGCQAVDTSDELFARELLEVEIELPPADWELLRHEHKSRHSLWGTADCLEAPVDSPYDWYAASVTIDGERFDDVGLRKKGLLGSQSELKPSLKVDFDRFVDGQHLDGLTRLGLNNSKADPTFARTCLAYSVFAAAGVPAPRCTFATVSLNGAPLGVYVAIEEVGKPFLARRMADPSGNLYEGTVSDFRAGYDGSFEQETNKSSSPDRADLAALTAILDATPDAELVAALEPVVDLDEYFAFWAAEALVWHSDGYDGNTNNFYVYADPGVGGRLRFIPWGPDGTFRRDTRANVPDSVLAFGALANRLYALPEGRQRYYAELDKLLGTAWNPTHLAAEASRISAVVRPHIAAAYLAEHDAAVADLIAIIGEREGAIDAALAGGQPAWTAGMRGGFCRIPVGEVTGTFTSTWGTLAGDAFASGTGTLSIDALDGTPLAISRVGVRTGYATTDTRGRLQMLVDLVDRRRLVVNADFADPRWFDPFLVVGDHLLASPPMTMTMTEQNLATTPVGTLRRMEIGEGTWTFTSVGTGPNEIVGHFAATAYLLP